MLGNQEILIIVIHLRRRQTKTIYTILSIINYWVPIMSRELFWAREILTIYKKSLPRVAHVNALINKYLMNT